MSQTGASSTPRRGFAPRVLIVIAAIVVVLAGVLFAMFKRGVLSQPASEETAPSREVAHEVAGQRAPSPKERAPAPRLESPPAPVADPVSDAVASARPIARREAKIVATQMKAQRYVEEAYPAWLRAHPGQECPQQLSELNEYMPDKNTKDGWGRAMRMQCGASSPSGKGIRVISLGRDGERSEDDIKFGE